MSGASPYRAAEDDLIRDACARKRADRIRDLARELGRSETAIRRRWQRLGRGLGRDPVPSSDPWRRIQDAAGCGLYLNAAEVAELAKARPDA